MKVEIGFKHAEMKSEDANDRAYYAGLLFFFLVLMQEFEFLSK